MMKMIIVKKRGLGIVNLVLKCLDSSEFLYIDVVCSNSKSEEVCLIKLNASSREREI